MDALAWGLAASIPAAARILWDGALSSAWRRRPQNMHADNPEDKSASLILCVHNDLDHLQTIWPLWRGQVFPKDWTVQWVIVNDGSTDGTQQWLSQQLAKDANPSMIVLVNHQKSRPGKKEALTKGIEAARCDRLVLTDADCRPGPDWAFHMASSLGNTPKEPIVTLGFSLPIGGPRLLQFDALRIAWQYGAAAARGHAYMGVGRNIAYRKHLWASLNGFQQHLNLSSGDDDLFVQSARQSGHLIRTFATQRTTMANPTVAVPDVLDGLKRKQRHLSTAKRYTPNILTHLALDVGLDSLIVLNALTGMLGLLHNQGWIPIVAAGVTLLFRAVNLSSFAKDLGLPVNSGFRATLLGPMRWGFLAVATLLNFTSSPTWTQRAPTSRS